MCPREVTRPNPLVWHFCDNSPAWREKKRGIISKVQLHLSHCQILPFSSHPFSSASAMVRLCLSHAWQSPAQFCPCLQYKGAAASQLHGSGTEYWCYVWYKCFAGDLVNQFSMVADSSGSISQWYLIKLRFTVLPLDFITYNFSHPVG